MTGDISEKNRGQQWVLPVTALAVVAAFAGLFTCFLLIMTTSIGVFIGG